MSQLDAARRLGIDRTTMVAMVDALERKDLDAAGRIPTTGGRTWSSRRSAGTRHWAGPGSPWTRRKRSSCPHCPAATPAPQETSWSAWSRLQRAERALPELAGPVVTAAQHLIAHVRGVGRHRSPPARRCAPSPRPQILALSWPLPAPAQHLDLQPAHLVGQLEQPLRRREHHRPEVRGQPEGVDVHAVAVHQIGQRSICSTV